LTYFVNVPIGLTPKSIIHRLEIRILSPVSWIIEDLRYIIPDNMKMVWIYVMLGCIGGFVALLVPSLDRYDSKGMTWFVIFLWVLCGVFLIVSLLAFRRASKLGKAEDEQHTEVLRRKLRGDYDPK